MPSATAAARSETPSLAYRLCRWVLTVAVLSGAGRRCRAPTRRWRAGSRISPSRVVSRPAGRARRCWSSAAMPAIASVDSTVRPWRDAADRVADLAAVGVLRDVAGRAEAQALVDVVALDVDGQDEHRARQPALPRAPSRTACGAQPRHPQVEHRDVRRVGPDPLQRLVRRCGRSRRARGRRCARSPPPARRGRPDGRRRRGPGSTARSSLRLLARLADRRQPGLCRRHAATTMPRRWPLCLQCPRSRVVAGSGSADSRSAGRAAIVCVVGAPRDVRAEDWQPRQPRASRSLRRLVVADAASVAARRHPDLRRPDGADDDHGAARARPGGRGRAVLHAHRGAHQPRVDAAGR